MKTLFKELCLKTSLSQSQAALLNFIAISLMKDEDSDVRKNVAYRIDSKFLPGMMKDENWDVRYRVANRIDSKFLPGMMKDEDSSVRCCVVQRMKELKECRILRKVIRESTREFNVIS